jgi:citrate synthase
MSATKTQATATYQEHSKPSSQHSATAKLIFNKNNETSHKTLELPILRGNFGQEVIDISALGREKIWSLDPGFRATAACISKITYIDGIKGQLLHRGYAIDDLANNRSFMDVCYLLLHEALPNQKEYQTFCKAIKQHQLVHDQIHLFFRGFPRQAHPMAIMIGVIGALSAFHHQELDMNNATNRMLAAYRLIAQMPTLAAMCHRYYTNQPFVSPNNSLNYSENFLNMMFAQPSEHYQPNPIFAKALDTIFTLHADHEQNASTSTVRVAASTGADFHACMATGIAALWGPAHGGANEACLNMLQEIGTPKAIASYIKRAKDPKDPFRLMGFGHRVYKQYDPRAKVMQSICNQVLKSIGHNTHPLFEVAYELEQIALKDAYFIEKKLYPNVDFYSGITLNAIGIPTQMFTVIFALARTVGWASHWLEMTAETTPLSRPRQLYRGPDERPVPQKRG